MNAQPGQRLLPQTILDLVLGDGALTLVAHQTGSSSASLARAMRRPDSAGSRLVELAATLLWQIRERGQAPLRMLEGVSTRLEARMADDPNGAAWPHAALFELLGPKAFDLLSYRLQSLTAATLRQAVRDPDHRHYRLYALVVLALEDLAATGRPARDALLTEVALHLVQPDVAALVGQCQEEHGTASTSV